MAVTSMPKSEKEPKNMEPRKGIFITFEGGEGAGKSTQIKLLKETIEALGYEVCLIREPGGTPVGEKIRALLLDKEQDEMSLMTELFLYEAARAQIVQDIIKPALCAGKIVLCDRFVDSTVAYQGFGRGIDPALVKQLNFIASMQLVPDCTILLQINPELGLGRAMSASKTGADRIESAGNVFHQNVFDGFELLAKHEPKRIHVVDGAQTLQQVQNEIWDIIVTQFPYLQSQATVLVDKENLAKEGNSGDKNKAGSDKA